MISLIKIKMQRFMLGWGTVWVAVRGWALVVALALLATALVVVAVQMVARGRLVDEKTVEPQETEWVSTGPSINTDDLALVQEGKRRQPKSVVVERYERDLMARGYLTDAQRTVLKGLPSGWRTK